MREERGSLTTFDAIVRIELRRQKTHRILGICATSHLKMQMRTTGFAAVTHKRNPLSRAYTLPFFYKIFQIMRLNRHQTTIVLDHNEVSVAPVTVRIKDFARSR